MPTEFGYQIATIIRINTHVLVVVRCGSLEKINIVCYRYLVSQADTDTPQIARP